MSLSRAIMEKLPTSFFKCVQKLNRVTRIGLSQVYKMQSHFLHTNYRCAKTPSQKNHQPTSGI